MTAGFFLVFIIYGLRIAYDEKRDIMKVYACGVVVINN